MLRSKKLLIKVVVGAVAVAAPIAAYAYFTASGTGSGTAAVGSVTGISIESSDPAGDLFPGGDLSVDVVLSSTNDGDVTLGDITGEVSVKPVVVNDVNIHAGCNPEWFVVESIDGPTVVKKGDSDPIEVVLSMEDVAASQDACQGADLDIEWTAAAAS
jgi:hypothetical protein